jgi:hypothetical protein
MLEESLVQQPTLIWNSARGVWEKPMASLFCEHWELFSEAWPTSGMMRNGQVFELQMQERHTADTESLSQQQKLPTPTTQDGKNNGGPSQFERNTKPLNTEVLLIGTPRANAADSSSVQVASGAPKGRIEDQVKLTNWGKFEPAITRWESTLCRPAPAPTKPDGKDDQHRLSSEFTEWMMGLEPGWITDCGLTRNEELKAAGNGVVPQQAELALRILLGLDIPKALERERERVNSDSNCLPYQYARRTNRKILNQTSEILDRSDWEESRCCSQDGARQVNLPTPTVSDTFTDNLASTQQKVGSMHSVTLPQAVKWLVD